MTDKIVRQSLVGDDFDPEGLLSPNSRWEPSEELDALLKVMLKPLQRFERRAVIKEFPRPASDGAFTPSLDNYLTSMISGAKITDNSLRDIQDKILDILGPLCSLYENITLMHRSLEDDAVTLDKATVVAMLAALRMPSCKEQSGLKTSRILS